MSGGRLGEGPVRPALLPPHLVAYTLILIRAFNSCIHKYIYIYIHIYIYRERERYIYTYINDNDNNTDNNTTHNINNDNDNNMLLLICWFAGMGYYGLWTMLLWISNCTLLICLLWIMMLLVCWFVTPNLPTNIIPTNIA